MTTQYITDKGGNKLAVILPIMEYQKLINDLEELEDIKLYDKSKDGRQEFVDAKQAFAEIEEERKKDV